MMCRRHSYSFVVHDQFTEWMQNIVIWPWEYRHSALEHDLKCVQNTVVGLNDGCYWPENGMIIIDSFLIVIKSMDSCYWTKKWSTSFLIHSQLYTPIVHCFILLEEICSITNKIYILFSMSVSEKIVLKVDEHHIFGYI